MPERNEMDASVVDFVPASVARSVIALVDDCVVSSVENWIGFAVVILSIGAEVVVASAGFTEEEGTVSEAGFSLATDSLVVNSETPNSGDEVEIGSDGSLSPVTASVRLRTPLKTCRGISLVLKTIYIHTLKLFHKNCVFIAYNFLIDESIIVLNVNNTNSCRMSSLL